MFCGRLPSFLFARFSILSPVFNVVQSFLFPFIRPYFFLVFALCRMMNPFCRPQHGQLLYFATPFPPFPQFGSLEIGLLLDDIFISTYCFPSFFLIQIQFRFPFYSTVGFGHILHTLSRCYHAPIFLHFLEEEVVIYLGYTLFP